MQEDNYLSNWGDGSWRDTKTIRRNIEEVRAFWKGLTKGDWSRFKTMMREDAAADREISQFIWQNIKTRGRLGREVLDRAGVKTVRELEKKNRRSK